MKQVTKKVISVMVAVLLLMFSSVSVFAAESPTAGKSIKVTIVPTEGGTGTYSFESGFGEGPNGGTLVHFEKKANDGYTFNHWEILEGDYTIVEENTNSDATVSNVNFGSSLIGARSFSKGYTIMNVANENITDASFTIEAYSDITASPFYTKNGSTEKPTDKPIDSNTGDKSPQTGDNTLLFFAGAIVLAVACSVIVVKRKIDKIEK